MVFCPAWRSAKCPDYMWRKTPVLRGCSSNSRRELHCSVYHREIPQKKKKLPTKEDIARLMNKFKEKLQQENAEVNTDRKNLLVGMELFRLLVTVVIDILCTVNIWNGRLGQGFATETIIFKDWVSSLVVEEQRVRKLMSDLFLDLHCSAM
jgi:hypothetical protein